MLDKKTASGLKIKPIGLTDNDRTTLEVAVQLLNAKGISTQLTNDDDTDINIIDAQTIDGQPSLANSSEGRLNIFFGQEEASNNSQHWLQSPVQVMSLYDTLNEALKDIYVEQPLKPAENTPPAAIKSESKSKSSQETEGKTEPKALLHYLLDAQKDKQSLSIENGGGYPSIVVDGETGQVITKATDEEFVAIASLKNNELTVSATQRIDPLATRDPLTIDLETAIWDAALYSPYAVPLDGISLDCHVKLTSWPMFTRLKFRPYHIKLTKLMASKPRSLNETSQLCEVPMNDVINFYNAALSMGLIIKPKTTVIPKNTPEENKKSSRAKKGLMDKLSNHLLPGVH